MTADNTGALVPVFQGNYGIHQSIPNTYNAYLALFFFFFTRDRGSSDARAKETLLKVWH